MPIGKFWTTSLIIPAQNTKPYPNLSGFFNIQKKIKIYIKLNEKLILNKKKDKSKPVNAIKNNSKIGKLWIKVL